MRWIFILHDQNTNMNADTIVLLWTFYIFVALIGSIFASRALERKLKAKSPETRPFRWGFYVGSMGVACAPLAVFTTLGMALAVANANFEAFGVCLASTVFLLIHGVAGWFIIQRKRWAWVVGTIFSFNIFVWVANSIYGSNRWREFAGEPYGSAGTEDEGYELLHDATNLETQGRVQEALLAYQRIVDKYSHTAAGLDAQKSIESLRAKIG